MITIFYFICFFLAYLNDFRAVDCGYTKLKILNEFSIF